MKRLIAIAAGTAFAATGAAAGSYSKSGPAMAEPAIPAPPAAAAAPRFNWTGPYAGAAVGYGRMSISGANSGSAGVGGLFGGYRWDMGSAVYGVEGQIAPAFGSPRLPNGERIRMGAGLMLTAGIPVSDDARTLVHGGIGPSLLRTSGAGGSKTAAGATAQLGVDYMLSDQIMVRGAVNYTAMNGVSNASYRTRTVGAGLGLAFKF